MNIENIRDAKEQLTKDVAELVTGFQKTYQIAVDKITIQHMLSDASAVPVSSVVHIDLAPL